MIGGGLRLSKCLWNITSFDWRKGKWTYKKGILGEIITVTNMDGNKSEVKQFNHSKVNKRRRILEITGWVNEQSG